MATWCGGPRDATTEGTNGILVDTHAPADLDRAVHALASDSVAVAAFGAAGRRTIEERFTIERIIGGHARICREALGYRNGS